MLVLGFEFFIFIAAFVVAAFSFLAFIHAGSSGSDEYPYERAGPLLTPAELNFFNVLNQVVPNGFIITFKVRIGDVLKVGGGVNKKNVFAMRGKIQQKHFDFVICRKDDMRVACCIELNDLSHNKPDRIKRDVFVRGACSAAGVTLLEVKNSRKYDVGDIRALVAGAIRG